MNQGILIEKVAKRASITKAEAERAINAVKEAITDSLRKNDKVTLVGSHRRSAFCWVIASNRSAAVTGT